MWSVFTFNNVVEPRPYHTFFEDGSNYCWNSRTTVVRGPTGGTPRRFRMVARRARR